MKQFLSLYALAFTLLTSDILAAQDVSADLLARVRDQVQTPDAAWTRLDLPDRAGEPFLVSLDLGSGRVHMELTPFSVRAPSFQLYVQREDGQLHAENAPAPVTYRGFVHELQGALVAASLTDEGLEGFIALPNGESYGFQPFRSVDARAERALHLVYHNSEIHGPEATCGVEDSVTNAEPELPGSPSTYASVKYRQEVAFDSDVEFFQDNGSSVNSAIQDIESILNGMDVIYDRDVNVVSVISAIVIRTTQPDPYTTNGPQGLLNQFKNHWNAEMRHITRDVAHLMSGRNLTGSVIGIAFPTVICSTGQAYALSQSTFSGNFTSRVGLTSHEIGHNYGSGHCNGVNPCYIMCPSLGGCSGNVSLFSPNVAAFIANYASNRPCLIEITAPLDLPFEARFPEEDLLDEHWTFRTMEQAEDDALSTPSLPYTALLDGKGGTTILGDELWSNEMLLQGESGMFLSFYVQHATVESGESLAVEYLSSSATWNLLETVLSDGIDRDYFRLHELSLPPGAYHDAFRLRFRAVVDENDDKWYLDDIRIQSTQVCAFPEPYGTSKISSSGTVPTVRWSGDNTLSLNNFSVFISNALPDQFCLTFWGTAPANTPFGGGTIWVASPFIRGPVLVTDHLGFAQFPVPIDAQMVGTTEYYQWFFRDPTHPDGTGTGLTDGLRVPYCP